MPFLPAAQLPYECTIHTLRMQGEDGRFYNVMLDLIRTGQNPAWGIGSDHNGLRAFVADAQTGQLLAATFVDAPREQFAAQHGRLHFMDADCCIKFQSARTPSGTMQDGSLDFELQATLLPSTLVQQTTDLLESALERGLERLQPAAQQRVRDVLSVQLAVTDYPKTQHTGTLVVKLRDADAPLRLHARGAPSTLSHHFGNSLTDYVFLASVPEPEKPSFIAVVTRDRLQPSPSSLAVPVGYLIRTDEAGESTFALLDPSVEKNSGGGFTLGAARLGCKLDVRIRGEAGQLLLNAGQLPAKTAFGTATLTPAALLDSLGISHPVTFEQVIIDVTGHFIAQTGRDA